VGSDGKQSNVVFKNAKYECQALIVIFGGDIQNLEEEMNAHQQFRRFSNWSFEAVLDRFSSLNKNTAVLAVLPSRMEEKTYSCFDNFVISDSYGSPTHDFKGQGNAVQHLECILKQLNERLSMSVSKISKKLIGFSKGVVVLNQLLLDSKSQLCQDFFDSVQTMCWLDGGHNGGKHTWLTDVTFLTDFSERFKHIKIEIRVTPRQIEDENRAWIGKEEAIFSATLLNLLGPSQVRRRVFFHDEKSLISHFRVLDTFEELPLL